ncbi:MAG: hypothetical protein ACPGJI_07810 [Kangiellaceae bacterium]
MQLIVGKSRIIKLLRLAQILLVISLSLFTSNVVAENKKLGKNMTDKESLLNDSLVSIIKSVVQAEYKTPISQFEITKVEKKNWPSSALGCAKANIRYMQMITPGYLVFVKANNKLHQVHTSDKHAVLCDQNNIDNLNSDSSKKIDKSTLKRVKAIQLSRAMLLTTKEIDAKHIRLKSVSNASIEQFGASCQSGYSGKNKGYKVVLSHKNTEIAYFSDGVEVVQCASHTKI